MERAPAEGQKTGPEAIPGAGAGEGAVPATVLPPASPAASAPSPQPSPDAEASRRHRTWLKVSGTLLMFLGAMWIFQFGQGAWLGPQVETWSAVPGGNLTITVQGDPQAVVTLDYRGAGNRTTVPLEADASAQVKAEWAYVTVQAVTANRTLVREVIVPLGARYNVTFDPAAPQPTAREGLDIAAFRLLWIHAGVALLVVIGAVFTFRLHAPRLAMAGAVLALFGSGYLVLGGSVSIIALGTLVAAVLAVWSIRRGKQEFRPLLLGSVML